MKLHYYPETDSLYIDLTGKPSVETKEIADGLMADFDGAGNVVGLDIEHASSKLDLSKVETISLPPASSRSDGISPTSSAARPGSSSRSTAASTPRVSTTREAMRFSWTRGTRS